jgi:hypothetical protein
MERTTWSRIVVCALALTAPGASILSIDAARTRTDAWVELVDPAQDDWQGEAFQVRAARQLRRLAELMQGGGPTPAELAGITSPETRTTTLRPAELTTHELAGGVRVRQLDRPGRLGKPVQRLPEAIAGLLAPFAGPGPRRFDFKIVRVELDPGRRPATTVRFEGRGGTSGLVQQTATWRVEWTRGQPADPPRIAEIRLRDFEEVRRDRLAFVDCTGSVLPAGADWLEQLRWGGEYWHGRVDAVGGLNLMGHHGIAVADVDGDGLEDLYVAMGNGLPNKLLVQSEDGTTRDVALEAGVAWLDDTKGVLFADMDNDGDQDLLVAIGPTIVLCINDGHGRFERFASMRAATPAAFYSLSVADFDLDGDLDVFGARYVRIRYGISVPEPLHDANNGPSNHLLRNDGERGFTDVTREVGLDVNNGRFSLVGAWADYDDDGDPDLYVANDFGRNNLYRNDGGRFVDVALHAGVEDQAAGMGVSWADYDLDGDLDLHVTNMFSAAGNRVAYQPRFKQVASERTRRQIQRYAGGNALFANQGDGTFRDVSDVAGIRMGRWGWGARFVDTNNDGLDDLVVPNGFLTGSIEDDL